MSGLGAAGWAEMIKARRSKVPWLTAGALCLAPLVGGLFMVILADPDRARLATGRYLILVDAMIVLLGIGLLTLPAARVEPMVPYGVGAIVGVSVLGLVPLLRATRP